MSEPVRIADEVSRIAEGGAWHGPSLAQNLAGVTAVEAAQRPLPTAHTIWETVHHVTAWANEVAERLRRSARPLTGAEDWPPVSATDDESWVQARESLFEAHRRLRAAVREFPPQRLGEIVPGQDNEADDVVSFYLMLHGLAQHDAYHAGQIALLRKALEQA